MLGGLALKCKWRERMKAAGKPTDKPNIITGPVQVCWHKFARYFDVELREIPLEHGRLGMTPEEVLKRVDENTIGVVPTFGVTFTCQYEPVAEVAEALDRLARDKHLDIPIHVDAASGGIRGPVCRTGPGLGLPHSPRPLHQRLRTQIRIGAARRGLGGLAREERSAGRPDILRELSGRQHAHLRAQFLAARRSDRFAVLSLPAARAARATAAFSRMATTPRNISGER